MDINFRPQRITTGLINRLQRMERLDKTTDIRDTDMKGLLLRVPGRTKKDKASGLRPLVGEMSFYVQLGRGQRCKIGTTKMLTVKEARRKARDELKKAEDEEKVLRRKDVPTLRRFLDGDYKDWAKTHLKDGATQLKRIERAFKTFLDTKLHKIEKANIIRWRSQRLLLGRKPSTVNRDVVALKGCLTQAVELGVLVKNPLRGLKNLDVPDGERDRFLSADEEKRLRTELRSRDARLKTDGIYWGGVVIRGDELTHRTYADHLEPLFLLAINTGIRWGALRKLQWHEVDFARTRVSIPAIKQKSDRPSLVPLNTEAREVLRAWKQDQQPNDPKGCVFPSRWKDGPITSVKTAWNKLLKRAGIENFRWHDNRHTFASNLRMAGVNLSDVGKLLGHADSKMTERYAHVTADYLDRAVESIIASRGNGMKEAWIQTVTNRQFFWADPQPDAIDIEDIAHSLSMLCRFNGHCARFYSVAEHSVHVSKIVPKGYELAGLLHDAAEAYFSDVPGPIKVHLPMVTDWKFTFLTLRTWKHFGLFSVLSEKRRLPLPMSSVVKLFSG